MQFWSINLWNFYWIFMEFLCVCGICGIIMRDSFENRNVKIGRIADKQSWTINHKNTIHQFKLSAMNCVASCTKVDKYNFDNIIAPTAVTNELWFKYNIWKIIYTRTNCAEHYWNLLQFAVAGWKVCLENVFNIRNFKCL